MKKLIPLFAAACLTVLSLMAPPAALATNCDQELSQCLADCASFGDPTINGQTCTSVCIVYYRACVATGGRYCPGYGGGSGCYEQN